MNFKSRINHLDTTFAMVEFLQRYASSEHKHELESAACTALDNKRDFALVHRQICMHMLHDPYIGAMRMMETDSQRAAVQQCIDSYRDLQSDRVAMGQSGQSSYSRMHQAGEVVDNERRLVAAYATGMRAHRTKERQREVQLIDAALRLCVAVMEQKPRCIIDYPLAVFDYKLRPFNSRSENYQAARVYCAQLLIKQLNGS